MRRRPGKTHAQRSCRQSDSTRRLASRSRSTGRGDRHRADQGCCHQHVRLEHAVRQSEPAAECGSRHRRDPAPRRRRIGEPDSVAASARCVYLWFRAPAGDAASSRRANAIVTVIVIVIGRGLIIRVRCIEHRRCHGGDEPDHGRHSGDGCGRDQGRSDPGTCRAGSVHANIPGSLTTFAGMLRPRHPEYACHGHFLPYRRSGTEHRHRLPFCGYPWLVYRAPGWRAAARLINDHASGHPS